MARVDQALNTKQYTRIFAYGRPHTRKTTWAIQAAELGFNVIYFDFDYNFSVMNTLSLEAQKRIYHIDCRTPLGDMRNCASLYLAQLMYNSVGYYNEQERRYTAKSRLEADKSYIYLDLNKLTGNDVVVVDSYTSFTTQLIQEQMAILDPANIPKRDWDDYAKQRAVADLILNRSAAVNAHQIWIGHSETYEKKKKGADGRPTEEIEFTRIQPASVSRNHAELLARQFTDTLFFSVPNTRVGTQISTKGFEGMDAGARTKLPKSYNFDELSFADFVSPHNLELVKSNSEFSSEAVKEITPEDVQNIKAEKKSASIQVGKSPIKLREAK